MADDNATVVQSNQPPESAPAPASNPERYELLDELARGGMGVVYRARDRVLNRVVGLKTLISAVAPESAVLRFRAEAHITGQLQHPNIPPVHDLGTLPDGRPFLAMKLIKGDTLDVLLKARPDPAHDRGRFVAVFEHIAQGVAYAHAHNVIHRDLKPQNVMVGAFGEVQVMDWGLAKVLGAPQPSERTDADAPAPTLVTAPTDDSDRTRAGSVMGTPAYMPREQAIGAIDQLDARSDVFSLGGILCTILTGAPPYVGSNAETTRQLAAVAKLDDAFARLNACGAEPELVALCKRCLSPEQADRPADAGAVARAVAEFRAEAERRARQAELDRVRAEGDARVAETRAAEEANTRREAQARAASERQRGRVQLALAGTLALLLAAGGAFAWWRDKQATERANELAEDSRSAEARVRGALSEAAALCVVGEREIDDPPRWRKTLVAARAAARRAEDAAAVATVAPELAEATRAALVRLARDEADCEAADAIDRLLIDLFALTEFDPTIQKRTERRGREVLAQLGLNPEQLPPTKLVADVRGHRLSYRLVVLLGLCDVFPAAERNSRMEQLIRSDDPGLGALRDAALGHTKQTVGELLSSRDGRCWTSSDLVYTAKRLHLVRRDRLANPVIAANAYSELLDEAVRRNPRDLIAHLLRQTITVNASFRLVGPGERTPTDVTTVRNLSSSAAALAIRPDSPHLWSKHGIALEQEQQHYWALSCYLRAIELAPDRLPDRCRVARCQLKTGDYRVALATARDAVARAQASGSPPGFDVFAESAGVAVLVGTGKERSGGPDSAERFVCRKEAREWLSASLARWETLARDPSRVQEVQFALLGWDRAESLAPVREPARLEQLPQAERTEWRSLWEEARRLQQRAFPQQSKSTFADVGKVVPIQPTGPPAPGFVPITLPRKLEVAPPPRPK